MTVIANGDDEAASVVEAWVARLTISAQSGEVLDLAQSPGDFDPGDPPERSLLVQRDRGFPSSREYPTTARVPAAAIRKVLLDSDLCPDPRGLWIHGAVITGALDLANSTLACPLAVTLSRFEQAPDLRSARLPSLWLTGSYVPGLIADRLHIDRGDFGGLGIESGGELRAQGARIAGCLYLDAATLRNEGGRALNVDGIVVSGDAFAGNLSVSGEVHAVGARFEGELSLHKAVLHNERGSALNLDGAVVVGNLSAGMLQAKGEISAIGVRVEGQLDLTAAALANEGGYALQLDAAGLGSGLFAQGLVVLGEICMQSAEVGGQLGLQGAVLTDEAGTALNLDGVRVRGSVVAGQLRAKGEVRALGARIEGSVMMREAVIANKGGRALSLDRAYMSGLFATELKVDGEMRLHGARIEGQLSLGGAVLRNEGGDALVLDGSTLTGGMFADGLKTTGGLRALDAKIDVQVSLDNGVLGNADGDALNFERAQVAGSVFAEGLRAVGTVRAVDARVAGQLDLEEAVLLGGAGDALVLDGALLARGMLAGGLRATGDVSASEAEIGGAMELEESLLSNEGGVALSLQSARVRELQLPGIYAEWQGTLNLTNCRVESLRVDVVGSGNPVPLSSAGWTLGEVHGILRHDSAAFVTWLDTAPEFTAQPWAEAAAFYDRAGEPSHARRLRVEMERRATGRLPRYKRWLRRAFYGGTVGYGYHPFQALWWLLGIGLIAAAIAWNVPGAFLLTEGVAASGRTATALQQEGPDPAIVALETVLPAAATATANPWQPAEAWVQVVLTVLKTMSWLLAVLFVAGITGLLRRRTA